MSPTKHPSSQITLGWSGAKSRLFLPALDLDNNFQGFDKKKWAAREMFSGVKKSFFSRLHTGGEICIDCI